MREVLRAMPKTEPCRVCGRNIPKSHLGVCEVSGMTKKLKSCPFCGGEVKIVKWAGYYCVSCENHNCMAKPLIGVFDHEDEAIVAWNRRANDE